MGLSLRTNFRWTLAGNVVNAGCWWGVVSLLAKLDGAEVVGQVQLGLAIVLPVTSFAMLQLRSILATDAHREFAFSDYFGLRVLSTAAALVAVAAIVLIRRDPAQTTLVIALIAAVKGVECISEVIRGLFQQQERMDWCGVSLMLRGAIALVVTAGLRWLTGSTVLALGGMIAVWGAVLFGYDLPRARRLLSGTGDASSPGSAVAPSFAPPVMWSLFVRAAPLGLVIMLGSLSTQVPRYILESRHSEAMLGYFGAMTYPIALGTMVISALGQTASPRLSRHYVDDRRAYRRLMAQLFGLGLVLGGAMIVSAAVFGRWLLRVIYRPEFAEFHTEFVLLALGGAIAFLASFCGYGLTAARVFKPQSAAAGLSCVVATVVALRLIPEWGVRGAAWAAVTSSLVTLGYFGLLLRRAMSAPAPAEAAGMEAPVLDE